MQFLDNNEEKIIKKIQSYLEGRRSFTKEEKDASIKEMSSLWGKAFDQIDFACGKIRTEGEAAETFYEIPVDITAVTLVDVSFDPGTVLDNSEETMITLFALLRTAKVVESYVMSLRSLLNDHYKNNKKLIDGIIDGKVEVISMGNPRG